MISAVRTVTFKRALCCSRAAGVRAALCTGGVLRVTVCSQGHSGLCKQAAGTGHADVQTQRHLPAAIQRLWDRRHHHRLGGRKPQQIRYAGLRYGSVTYTINCCHTKHTFKKSTKLLLCWRHRLIFSLWTCPWVTRPHRNTAWHKAHWWLRDAVLLHAITAILRSLMQVRGWSGICCLTQPKTSLFARWPTASVTWTIFCTCILTGPKTKSSPSTTPPRFVCVRSFLTSTLVP